MSTSRVLKFRSRRAPAQTSGVSMEPAGERLFCILAGASIACFGFGLMAVTLYFTTEEEASVFFHKTHVSRTLAVIPIAVPLGLIGLFGLNWLIQGLRGRSRHEGIFYWVLQRLGQIGPRPWSVFAPLAFALALAVAALEGEKDILRYSARGLILWLAFMGNVAIHELGHALGARVAGLRVTRLLIGPLAWDASGFGQGFHFSREWLSLFGGYARAELSASPPTARQSLIFSAGGPIATILLVAGVAAGPYRLADLLRGHPGSLTQEACSVVVSIAVGLLALNLFPSRQLAFGQPTDGYQILGAVRALVAERKCKTSR